jgi:hypothetical protein
VSLFRRMCRDMQTSANTSKLSMQLQCWLLQPGANLACCYTILHVSVHDLKGR